MEVTVSSAEQIGSDKKLTFDLQDWNFDPETRERDRPAGEGSLGNERRYQRLHQDRRNGSDQFRELYHEPERQTAVSVLREQVPNVQNIGCLRQDAQKVKI